MNKVQDVVPVVGEVGFRQQRQQQYQGMATPPPPVPVAPPPPPPVRAVQPPPPVAPQLVVSADDHNGDLPIPVGPPSSAPGAPLLADEEGQESGGPHPATSVISRAMAIAKNRERLMQLQERQSRRHGWRRKAAEAQQRQKAAQRAARRLSATGVVTGPMGRRGKRGAAEGFIAPFFISILTLVSPFGGLSYVYDRGEPFFFSCRPYRFRTFHSPDREMGPGPLFFASRRGGEELQLTFSSSSHSSSSSSSSSLFKGAERDAARGQAGQGD